MGIDFVAFGIVIDDIVFHDGQTQMGVLGGGGPQTAFGMRLWTDPNQVRVGLSASIGNDFPPEMLAWIRVNRIDPSGLRYSETATLRAWQIIEQDGRRIQIWRSPGSSIKAHLKRSAALLPEAYQHARGYHVGIHPNEPDFQFIDELHSLGGLVSVEPFKPAETVPGDDLLHNLLSTADIFSPNFHEAGSLVGGGSGYEIVQKLLYGGAVRVALRLGADGVLVGEKGMKSVYHIPAYPTRVIDPLGAGNTFCGGFLSGWVDKEDLLTAGLYGVVSASFMIEQLGLPTIQSATLEEANRRVEFLRPQIKMISS